MPNNYELSYVRINAFCLEKGLKIIEIDIDILLYDDVVTEMIPPIIPGVVAHPKMLKLPSTDIIKYAHVAIPLAEIAPQLRHPSTHVSIQAIAATMHNAAIKQRMDLNTHEHS